jgi:hypothetical protein
MRWTKPHYEQMKMDAEIGSYQEDTDPVREAPLCDQVARRTAHDDRRTRVVRSR